MSFAHVSAAALLVIASNSRIVRGSYQAAILRGSESMSGSTLRGSARTKWGGRYAHSRVSLLARLEAAGLVTKVVREGHRNVLLVTVGSEDIARSRGGNPARCAEREAS